MPCQGLHLEIEKLIVITSTGEEAEITLISNPAEPEKGTIISSPSFQAISDIVLKGCKMGYAVQVRKVEESLPNSAAMPGCERPTNSTLPTSISVPVGESSLPVQVASQDPPLLPDLP